MADVVAEVVAEVKWDFQQSEETMLDVGSGERVNVLFRHESGWTYCTHKEDPREGWIPDEYLEMKKDTSGMQSPSNYRPKSVRPQSAAADFRRGKAMNQAEVQETIAENSGEKADDDAPKGFEGMFAKDDDVGERKTSLASKKKKDRIEVILNAGSILSGNLVPEFCGIQQREFLCRLVGLAQV